MTVEHRLLFGLTDIRAVTFECQKCKLRLSLTPDTINKATGKCPSCDAVWLSPGAAMTKVAGDPVWRLLEAVPAAVLSEQHDSRDVRILIEFASDETKA